MLASASIPVAFPPVFFDVDAGGGATTRCTSMAASRRMSSNAGWSAPRGIHPRAGRGAAREEIYIIHNGQLRPSRTRRRGQYAVSLARHRRSPTRLAGDPIRIYAFAVREQASFHWITIPSVDLPGSEVFDPVEMAKLFEIGYKAARAGPVWAVEPPGLQEVPSPP